jgi:hypothetical protein
MLGAMRHQKVTAYVRQLFYIPPAQKGGCLLFYVELFPDFLAFVFY